MNKYNDDYFKKRISKFGMILWYLYIFELFRDGDGTSFIYNNWNPLAYLFGLVVILMVFITSGIDGIQEEWEDDKIGWAFSDYWKNPDHKIRYIPRY